MSSEIVLDGYAFLVSETDDKGVITFANDDFCSIAGYSLKELIGKPHSIVRHKDMPKIAFKTCWDTIKKGDTWTGYVKNKTKTGDYYWVYATIYPFETCDGSKGYISCRRKPSKDEIKEHEILYKKLKEQE